MSEPKYDEDLVNLGYLKRVISDTEEGINIDFKNVSRHYGSQPIPPYYEGDTWVDGNIVYTCINTRLVGSYTAADWTTESGALQKAESKNRVFLTQPSNYKPGDMWILQSDNDHRAGTKGEILISTAGRAVYDSDDWINMLGYGTIRSINEVAGNLNNAITRIGVVEEAIEDGLIITFYQASVPEGVHIGDLWYVTGTVTGYTQGKIYRYNGSTWDLLDDPAIQQAFTEANNARLVADGKIQSFYSASEPTTGDIGVGDLWIDTDDNNKLYRYNGTNWVACYDTRIDGMVETVEKTTERVTSIETDLGKIDLTVKETTTKVTTIEGQLETLQDVDGQSEGKYIYLDDASDELITSAKFNGETSQATRSGKNMIPMSSFDTMGNNGSGFTYDASNHRITYSNENNSGRGVYRFFDNFVVGTTYTLSFDIRGTAGKVVKIGWNKNTQDYTLKASYERVSYPFTVPTTREAIVFYTTALSAGGLTTDEYMEFDNVMITTDGSTDYEEYGVMPSPDYPSEIENLEGRNIFDEVLENGGFNSDGTNGANAYRIRSKNYTPVKENTNYTISVGENNTGKTLQVSISYYDKNDYTTARLSYLNWTNFNSPVTFTTPTNCKYIRIIMGYTNGTTIDINDGFDKFMIQEGTVATPYAPYNSLKVKVVNKNLLNKNKTALGSNVTKTVLDTGVRITTKNAGNARYCGIEIGKDELLGKKVTISANIAVSGTNNASARLFFGKYNTPSTSGIGTALTSTGSNTVTIPNTFYTGTDRIYLLLYSNVNGDTSVDNYVDYTNLQVEINDEATEYEEYKEQTVYFPLAEGQKLYEGSYLADDGIHNTRKQIVFDGTENWYFTSNCVYTNAIKDLVKKTPNNQVANILCDYYLKDSLANCYNNVNDKRISINNQGYMYIYDTTYTSANSFKTWLLNNPVTAEYELAEEEVIPYNTEQQAAWNSIKSLHTYKTVTHIYSDAYAEIGYIKDNGLDIYETKHEASRKYIETTEKFAQQKITNESIENTVSQTVTTVANNYNELKTKFDDYAPKSDVITLQTSVNQIMTDTYTKTEINEKLTDGSVTKVSTTAGTFDSNGLTIEKTDAKTKGNFNHEGIKVMDTTSGSNQELLFAGYDEEINETIVRTNNLTVNKYFTLKNVSRQEKYVNPVLGGKGIGTFIL